MIKTVLIFRNVRFAFPGLLFVFTLSFAGTTLAFPHFDIRPKVSASFQSDANFFNREENERAIYTRLYQPGIEAAMETAKSWMRLDYTLDMFYYKDKNLVPKGEKEAKDYDFTGGTGIFRGEYRIFDRLLLGIDDVFYKTRDKVFAERHNTAMNVGELYTHHQLTPVVIYGFEREFTAEFRFQKSELDYHDPLTEDADEDRGMLDLIYNFSDRSYVDLKFHHWRRNYDLTTSDYTSNHLSLFFIKQFKYVTFDAGLGWQRRDFKNSFPGDEDFLHYRIGFIVENPPKEYLPGQEAPFMERPRTFFSATFQSIMNDHGLGNSYFKGRQFIFKAERIFLDRILFNLTGYYQKSDYINTYGLTRGGQRALREDETFEISGHVGYELNRQITLFFTGGYERQNSNIAHGDYKNRYFGLKIALGHSFGSK